MTNREAIARIIFHKIAHKINEPRAIYISQALDKAIEALEENEGLRLLVNWAIECGFGYDNIPEEYEKYKEEISDMDYTEGLIYIAKKEVNKE